ncbi:MAG: hypothetical protein ACLQFR_00365 [Streptosporangiaceae bacterium]
MRRTARVTDALRGRKKAVAYVGTAAALLGAGTAGAATVASTAHAPAAAQATTVSTVSRPAAKDATSQAPDHRAVGVGKAPEHQKAGNRKAAGHRTAAHLTAATAHGSKSATRAAEKVNTRNDSWSHVVNTVAKVSPGTPAAANKLDPVAPTGPQAWMPISGAQLDNAKTIVKQAYAKKMGVRSAVIAVATSMQEATLNNINYGTSDSVGLFQQRPSCGWGDVQQIMHPAYAADAFLTALHQHQASDPGWATQPLWANAQAVQQSGFPFAYAKWETQAAQLVKQITTQLR